MDVRTKWSFQRLVSGILAALFATFSALAQVSPRINFSGVGEVYSLRPGLSLYTRTASDQTDSGHPLGPAIFENAPAGRASYYVSGTEYTPLPGGFAEGSSATGFRSMPNFGAAFGLGSTGSFTRNREITNLTFRFGPKNGDLTKSWSLGGDQEGVNWWKSARNVEERVYEANPEDVSAGLYYQGTEVISLSYSPIHVRITYHDNYSHGTAAFGTMVPRKSPGLTGFEETLTDSLLADIAANGGFVHFWFNDLTLSYGPHYQDANFSFQALQSGYEMIVVPEPEHYALMFAGALLGVGWFVRRRRCRNKATRLVCS